MSLPFAVIGWGSEAAPQVAPPPDPIAVDTQLRTQRGAVCVLEIWNVIRFLRAGEAAKRFV